MWNSFSMCSRQSEVVCCYFDKLQTAPTKTHLRTYMESCTAKPANDSSVGVLDNRGLKHLHKPFNPIKHNVKTQLLIKADMTWLLPHSTTETQIIITPICRSLSNIDDVRPVQGKTFCGTLVGQLHLIAGQGCCNRRLTRSITTVCWNKLKDRHWEGN